MKQNQKPEDIKIAITSGSQSPVQVGKKNRAKGIMKIKSNIKIDNPYFLTGLAIGIIASIIAGLILRLL